RSSATAETVRHLTEQVNEIASHVHRLAYRLHPFKLDYLGLAAAARVFCAEGAATHAVTILFTERDVPSGVPKDRALCVYRVLQEALSNVVRHSGAPRAEVELYGDGDAIGLIVRDYGVGMAHDVAATTQGLGLASMQERVRLVDGVLTVDAALPAGTR